MPDLSSSVELLDTEVPSSDSLLLISKKKRENFYIYKYNRLSSFSLAINNTVLTNECKLETNLKNLREQQ